jgi:hypothetical protein
LLLKWLPNVEPFLLANAGHLLHLENLRDLAQGMVAFLVRHPIGTRTGGALRENTSPQRD